MGLLVPEDSEDLIERLRCKNTVSNGDKAFYYTSKSNSNFSYKLVQCLRNNQTNDNQPKKKTKHLFHEISCTQGINLSNCYANCNKIKY